MEIESKKKGGIQSKREVNQSVTHTKEERQMKKMFLVLFMILALTGIAFADQPSGGGNATATATATQSQGIGSGNILNGQGGTISILSPSATGGVGGAGGAGGSVTNTQVGGTFAPTFNPTNTNNVTVKPNINTNIGNGIGNFSPSAKATIEKGAVDIDNTNKNTNVNVNKPVNIVDTDIKNTNKQGQSQSNTNTFNPVNTNTQGQNVNNEQNIAPVQEVNIKSPTQLLNAPSQMVPELNFGTGRMKDVTFTMPNFAIYGIKKYAGEMIVDVLNVNANVKFKNYYKAILSGAKDLSGAKGFNSNEVKIQVICAEAQKTWTTGGNLGGAGSIVSATGLGGGSGAGSIIPNWGGTKADDLFTIIFVKVAIATKVSMDDQYKKEGWKKIEGTKAPSAIADPKSKKSVFGKEVSD